MPTKKLLLPIKECFYRYHNGEHWSLRDLEWDEIEIDKNEKGCFCKACGEKLSDGPIQKKTQKVSSEEIPRKKPKRKKRASSFAQMAKSKNPTGNSSRNSFHGWKVIFY